MKIFLHHSLELRKQLIVLILIIFIPVVAILLFTGYRQHQRTLRDIEDNANQLIHLFIKEQMNIVNGARQLLDILSHVAVVRDLDLGPCNELLKAIHKDNPQYSTLVVANKEGFIDCCAIPLKESIDVKDRSWFQRVATQKKFIVDDFIISRSAHKASLPFAFPVLNRNNELVAVVGAAYNLDSYSNILSKINLPNDSVIFVIDSQKSILYQSISRDDYVGSSLMQCRGFDIPDSQKGSVLVDDSDGVRRIYWFERLSVGEESNQISIVVGISEQATYSEARRMLALNLSLLTALALLSFAMAWFFGKRCILDPVNLLVKKTRHVQRGDLSPSNVVGFLPGELSILAQAFDDMLSSLSRRESERDEALNALKREICQHKETVVSLLEREEHLRILFEQAADAIYVSRLDGSLVKVNRQACRATGYSEEELLGMNVIEMDARATSSESFQEFAGKLAHGCPVTVESRHRRKDGSTFPVEITIALLETHDGPRILGLARDITQRRKVEEEKDKMENQLLQAQKLEAVGRLAGGVAHDFNNMLSVILGHSEMVLDEIEPAHPLYRDIIEIQQAAQRSADLTRQLLAFARKQTISPKVLDLNETASGFLKMLGRLIGEDIDLVWMPGQDVWPVRMDPSQIDQILANLAVNARDAIGGVGTMTIETDNVVFDEKYCQTHQGVMPGDYVLLAVSDTGSGMDKETLNRIFEPFFTTKELGKGTGLGLATVYGIVKQNHGFINVYSEPRHGTTFKIYLPRAERRTEEKSSQAGSRNLHGTETVLLVEDEASILALGRSILERWGYVVLAAQSPSEALQVAQSYSGPIDLLITDVVMPEMNGKDLRDRLQALRPGFKCIFMSGYTANVIAHQGVLDEKINFLQKPFSVRTLAEKVREILDG